MENGKIKTTVIIENKKLDINFSTLRVYEKGQKEMIEVIQQSKHTTYFEQFHEILRTPPVGGWNNEALDTMFTRAGLMNKLQQATKIGATLELQATELTQLQESNKGWNLAVFSIELAQMKKYIIDLKI